MIWHASSTCLASLISTLLRICTLDGSLANATVFKLASRRCCLLLRHVRRDSTLYLRILHLWLTRLIVSLRWDHELLIVSEMYVAIQSRQIDLHFELRLFTTHALLLLRLSLFHTHLICNGSRCLCETIWHLMWFSGVISHVRPTVLFHQVVLHDVVYFICASTADTALAASLAWTFLIELLSFVNGLEGIVLEHDSTLEQFLVHIIWVILVRETKFVLQIHYLALKWLQLWFHHCWLRSLLACLMRLFVGHSSEIGHLTHGVGSHLSGQLLTLVLTRTLLIRVFGINLMRLILRHPILLLKTLHVVTSDFTVLFH